MGTRGRIDQTADIAHAARCVIWGKCVNAGQTCVAPDYALVHASKSGEFLDAARLALSAFYGATEEGGARAPISAA